MQYDIAIKSIFFLRAKSKMKVKALLRDVPFDGSDFFILPS